MVDVMYFVLQNLSSKDAPLMVHDMFYQRGFRSCRETVEDFDYDIGTD